MRFLIAVAITLAFTAFIVVTQADDDCFTDTCVGCIEDCN